MPWLRRFTLKLCQSITPHQKFLFFIIYLPEGDNETEFKNANVDTFLDKEGISHEFSATYTPQQNGVVERKNRTLIEMARMMLDEYKTPRHFWAEAVETACHATNRLYFTSFLGRQHTSFSPVTNPKLDIFKYLAQVLHSL